VRTSGSPDTADIVIVGGGIAGLAAAVGLAEHRAGSILLLEQESEPGRHSTARNASLLLQHTEDPIAARLAMASRPFYAELAAGEAARFRPVGSLLLFSGSNAIGTGHARVAAARELGLDVEQLTPGAAARRVPILDASRFQSAAFCASDGVIEIGATVHALTRRAERAGITIRCGVHVDAIMTAGDRVTGVATTVGPMTAGLVVIAAGAAASPLGTTIGAPLPLRVTRRHLAVTEPWNAVDASWPFVWDLDAGFYFRPETGGLMLCPCDVVDAPDGDIGVRPETVAATREMVARLIPSARDLSIANAWAGLRTLTPDDRFVIGPDPRLAGLAWLVGLGGHGMAGGPAAGQMLAQLLTGASKTVVEPATVGVSRFLA